MWPEMGALHAVIIIYTNKDFQYMVATHNGSESIHTRWASVHLKNGQKMHTELVLVFLISPVHTWQFCCGVIKRQASACFFFIVSLQKRAWTQATALNELQHYWKEEKA